jgi:glycerol uptake facilitator-like aquaporin
MAEAIGTFALVLFGTGAIIVDAASGLLRALFPEAPGLGATATSQAAS